MVIHISLVIKMAIEENTEEGFKQVVKVIEKFLSGNLRGSMIITVDTDGKRIVISAVGDKRVKPELVLEYLKHLEGYIKECREHIIKKNTGVSS